METFLSKEVEGGGDQFRICFLVLYSLYKAGGRAMFNPGIFPYEF